MRSFYFRPGKNAMMAVFMAAFAIGAGQMWWLSGGMLLAGFACLMAAAAAKLGFDAMNHEPALKFDRQYLWVRKAFGGHEQVPWCAVQSIGLQVFTLRYAGLIPVGRTEYLSIACNGGAFGTRRLRLTTSTLELPPGGGAGLAHILQQAHVDALGVAGVAMAGAGREGWGVAPAAASSPVREEPRKVFDADAALARYLAKKEAAQAQTSPAAAGANLAMQPRPTFGRRVR